MRAKWASENGKAILPNFTHLAQSQSKHQHQFLTELKKSVLKFIEKQMSQSNSEQHGQGRDIIIPDLKVYYKAKMKKKMALAKIDLWTNTTEIRYKNNFSTATYIMFDKEAISFC